MNKFLYLTIGLLIAVTINTGVAVADTEVELTFDAIDELIGDSEGDGFSSNGIYGCEGAAYGSVGAQGPTGAHVPVFDSATFDQVKLLTYKECLLDGIANSTRDNLISKMIEAFTKFANEGFDGNPIYITNFQEERLRVSDSVADEFLTGSEFENIPAQFRDEVRFALAEEYAANRSSADSLKCDLSDSGLNSIKTGTGGFGVFFSFATDPACNPVFALQMAKNRLNNKILSEIEDEEKGTFNGIRSITEKVTTDIGGGQTRTSTRIVTPGVLIAEQLKQILGTGLRQTENADEIDEIITSLMSNIGTQMLTDIKGLAGLTTSFGGESSYVSRLVQGSADRARGNLIGAAASVINSTIANESEYIQARQQAAGVLNNSSRQLESWENTCWGEIIDRAEEEMVAIIESRVCPSTSEECNVTVQTSRTSSSDSIYVYISSSNSGAIRVQGSAQNTNSTVAVSASINGVTVTEEASVSSTGDWEVTTLDLTTLDDGSVLVSAVESLAANSGTLAPLTATVVKVSSSIGVALTTPTTSPTVTVTATSSSYVESATIETTKTNSSSVIESSISSNLGLLGQKIEEAINSLTVLTQLANALEATTTSAGQRDILEYLDRLIASGVLHSSSDVRAARSETVELETLMQQVLEATRTDWQSSWCDPDNWEDYTI